MFLGLKESCLLLTAVRSEEAGVCDWVWDGSRWLLEGLSFDPELEALQIKIQQVERSHVISPDHLVVASEGPILCQSSTTYWGVIVPARLLRAPCAG